MIGIIYTFLNKKKIALIAGDILIKSCLYDDYHDFHLTKIYELKDFIIDNPTLLKLKYMDEEENYIELLISIYKKSK